MCETLWTLLDAAAAGGAIWLLAVLVLAVLGEMGLPFTSPVLESVLIFMGFQLAHGALAVASLPFLAVAYTGRLLGSASAYQLSMVAGARILERWGGRFRLTPHRVHVLKARLSSVLIPTIVLARFTPGLTILTSFICGVSRISRRQFQRAVAGQILMWEVAFIAAGALGGVASRSVDPTTYPRVLTAVIGLAISLGAVGAYLAFHKTRVRSLETQTPSQSP